MTLAHVSQSGNICIPKAWRDELGIEPNSDVLLELKQDVIVIEPLKERTEAFQSIDEEITRRKISFTRKEAVQDDLYD